ncbi:MAG: adenylyltransferase/cytidyltransferase family protein [Lentisphaerae bacterium]|nr:adenylyltransferase/cytidyltransferase family protein [Lentisphaerota bacterium]
MISAKVQDLDELARLLGLRREAGEKVVFTNGCFDLLHQGHISLVRFSKQQGDLLVVGVNSDASARALKGPNRPILGQQERAGMLAALADVDYVVIFDSLEVTPVVERLRPDVLIKGGDYRPDGVVGHEIVESYGGRIVIAPLVEGISTTDIVERVMDRYTNDEKQK